MRHLLATFTVGLLLWLTAGPVQAAGFGRLVNDTHLGQPLNVAAPLQLAGGENLARECLQATVRSGDNRLPDAQVRVSLERGAGPDERVVRVTTRTLIDEPVVTVELGVGCNVRMARQFVVLVDPAPVDGGAAPTRLAAQRTESDVTSIVSLVQGDPQAQAPAVGQRAVVPREAAARARTGVAAVAPKPRRMAAAASAATRAKPARAVPRLQLDAEPRVLARAPAAAVAPAATVATAAAAPASTGDAAASVAPAPMVAALSPSASAASAALPATATSVPVAPAAAGTAADSTARAVEAAPPPSIEKERQRIGELEATLARLSRESESTRQSVAALQLRVQTAESERYANPLVYLLAGLCCVLALAIGGVWRRRSRHTSARRSHWAPLSEGEGEAEAELLRPVTGQRDPLAMPPTGAPVVEPFESTDARGLLRARDPAAGASLDAPDTLPAPQRAVAVEELIDLEQQAEFFVVLGQDDAAVDLLESHLRLHDGVSPLPYMKLLEIHRRRGDEAAYTRVRERFHRGFNASAPAWGTDMQDGRDLDDYPAMLARLQSLWPRPDQAMDVLDDALFRRHAADETYDLPAHRELLLLYAVARDLLEHRGAPEPAPGVVDIDLLLPLDVEPAPPDPGIDMPLDFDLSVSAPLGSARPAMSVAELDSRAALLEFAELPARGPPLAYPR